MTFPLQLVPVLLAILTIAHSAVHPAKRQFDTIQDVCGTDPVDCGDGWCCFVGQECIPAQGNEEPQCRDNILTDLGGDPITIVALPFSSFLSEQSSLNSKLTSLGVTYTTFPTTLPTTGSFTALPTYSDNTIKSFTPPTNLPTALPSAVASSTTGAAALQTVNLGWMVGGVVGAGVLMGV
ncbi:hypothetical protein BDV96DRAFT_689455 [Lophiotrema nucula]|uniref:Uncharacterized protein n=1 Tax=Lophiotrema nucula TaxID=690887 RepID=A0A6A5Z1D5_9PLEO|nr:hypothetical protein BDV96DRAFT_689455 [Lophiotrema nucula]